MPTGGGPYAYRPAFEVMGKRPVSIAEVEEARKLFWRRTAILGATVQHRRTMALPIVIAGAVFCRPARNRSGGRREPRNSLAASTRWRCGRPVRKPSRARNREYQQPMTPMPDT